MRFRACVWLLSLALVASLAQAATIYQVQVTNVTGGNVWDVHITYAFTGGGLSNAIPLQPANWTASISGGNTVNGDWNNTVAIANNGIWSAQFTSQLSGIQVVGGNWTDQAGANIGNISATQVATTVVPEPGSLILFAAGGALIAAWRRQAMWAFGLRGDRLFRTPVK
jgi:hypothetical protein